ncbi:MAG: phosphoribosylamine--glycine ligase, partial [Maricaulaceae bacterium]
MRVQLVGAGGREHALAWRLAQSPSVDTLICAPGNPGMRRLGDCVPVKPEDVEGQVALAKARAVDLVVVGPEAPLAAGLADRLSAEGIAVFGPSAKAARIESSKAYAKAIMAKAGVPTAGYAVFTDRDAAKAYIADRPGPYVLKADGLAGGKGVVIAQARNEAHTVIDAMFSGAFGGSGAA